jgi:hypothetical protein
VKKRKSVGKKNKKDKKPDSLKIITKKKTGLF